MLGNSTSLDLGVGIHAVEVYIPKKFVNQTELEAHYKVAAGKFTIGLGQSNMGMCDDREDIYSVCLTVVHNLLEKYNIPATAIGRLEVGTETIIDKSKAVKTVLMDLLAESGNTDVEGVDSKNACYGGTNALFNSIHWLESSYWDGRYALVVMADIAVYKSLAARPTGGAGAVAILLGRDAPIVFDQGLRASHMENVWDFYKPDLHSEYPVVDGALSNECYVRAVDKCFERYMAKFAKQHGTERAGLDAGDFYLFHSPYGKLVQKSFGRLAYNDMLRDPSNPRYESLVPRFAHLAREDTYTDKDLERAFVDLTKADYGKKVAPSMLASKHVGNMYCASLYAALASLLSEVPSDSLVNKRLVLFSYGSGLASSMFSCYVRAPVDAIAKNLNLAARLAARTQVSPEKYDVVMLMRETAHNAKEFVPTAGVEDMFPGTYYLAGIDSLYRRHYERVPLLGAPKENGHVNGNGIAH